MGKKKESSKTNKIRLMFSTVRLDILSDFIGFCSFNTLSGIFGMLSLMVFVS